MPNVTCSVYQRDGSTLVGDLTLAKGIEATWGERSNNSGSLTLPFGSAQAGWLLADAPRIVRVFLDVGTGPEAVFDWIVERFQRDLSDESGGTFRFSGSGLRAAMVAGQVRPYTDCSPTGVVQSRNLGFADPSYDTSGLPNAESYGVHGMQQSVFGDVPRAPGFPDKAAEFIWSVADGAPTPVGRNLLFSPTFEVDEDGLYVMSIQADDEYISYLVGEEIGRGAGFYRWRDGFDTYLLELCAGVEYEWVIDAKNPANPGGQQSNIAWALGTLGPASADGKPQAQNEIVEILTDHTAGVFILRPIISVEGVEVAPNTTPSELQSFLDALLGPNRVEVSAAETGDGWRIEFVGFLANITIPIHLTDVNLSGGTFLSKVPIQDGSSSSRVMHTDTNWTVVAYPEDPVGLNAYELASLVVGEAVGRGDTILEHVTYGTMDATVDALGTAWGFEIELEVSPYTTKVSSILTLIEQQGYDLWFEPGWVLQIAQDRAENRTPNAVDLSTVPAGTGTSWKGERVVANTVTSDSKGGIIEAESATSQAKHGRWEEHFTTPDGSDPAANAWLSAYLSDVDEFYIEGTVEWPADEPGTPVIGDDVDWADTVTAELPGGTTGDARVVAIGLRVDDDNDAVTYRAIYVPQ